MDSPVDEVAFLARSENRVRVLRSLDEGTRTRRELREELAVSRTTLGRTLNEFEDRGLARRTAEGYATTPAADAILAKFVPLLETVEGIRNLGEALDWLPPPARELEVRDFRDADVTTATTDNPAAPFDRGLELIRGAEEYRGLTATAIPRYVEALVDGHRAGRLAVEGVIEARFVEGLGEDAERAARWRYFAERPLVRVHEGPVPINMHVVDGTVAIWLGERRADAPNDEDGMEIHGLLESDRPAVLSWAESLYEAYRAEAEPLELAAVTDA